MEKRRGLLVKTTSNLTPTHYQPPLLNLKYIIGGEKRAANQTLNIESRNKPLMLNIPFQPICRAAPRIIRGERKRGGAPVRRGANHYLESELQQSGVLGRGALKVPHTLTNSIF